MSYNRKSGAVPWNGTLLSNVSNFRYVLGAPLSTNPSNVVCMSQHRMINNFLFGFKPHDLLLCLKCLICSYALNVVKTHWG